MTPQLSAFVAAGRASELAGAAQRARRDVAEPAQKPATRSPGLLACALPGYGSRSAPSISCNPLGHGAGCETHTLGVLARAVC
jgi:hypothetical protein